MRSRFGRGFTRVMGNSISQVCNSKLVVWVTAIAFATSVIGLACSVEDSEPATPERSDVMKGVDVVKSSRPTAEGVTIVEPLNPTGPRRGGVLAAPMTWCPSPDPAIDDAYQRISLDSTPLVTEIHAGLTQIADDPAAPFDYALAESYQVDQDGLAYEFILRNGLKFSDGSPLTSSDVKWSWERALKMSIASGRARDTFGVIEGADAVVSGDSEDLSGVVAVDDRRLQVKLTDPRANFPALLADPVASVMKKENVLDWGMEWDNSGNFSGNSEFRVDNMPVGAGPFKLVLFSEGLDGGSCAISRNPHYWGEPAYLDGVWFRPEAMDRQPHEDGGETVDTDPMAFVNEATDFEPVWLHQIEDESGEDGLDLFTDPIDVEGARDGEASFVPIYVFMVLNAAAPPFDDINFRRAAAAFANLATYGGVVDDEARLITEELTSFEPSAEFIGYDVDVAQSHLAASKYAKEEEAWDTLVVYSGTSFFTSIEEPSFRSWAQELNLTLEDDHSGVPSLDEFDGQNNSKYHLRIYDVSPMYPDPVTVLRVLADPFGKLNRAPEFVDLDAMLAEAGRERDAVTRHEMYLDIEDYVADMALVIPIRVIRPASPYRVQPWVHDLNPPKYPGSMFHKVWLDDTAPKRELPTP